MACWRAAELQQIGINARPYIRWRRRPNGSYIYHALVAWPDGRIEDPSIAMGMRGPQYRRPIFVAANDASFVPE
jgi:hypothetical protein